MLALQTFHWEDSLEATGWLCLGLGRQPSSGICSKQLIALDPFWKRLCRHVFLQWTTRDGGTLPEEPAAFGIRWLERSPFSVFKTKSLFNICCREFSWLGVPRETVLSLLFPVSLLIKVIFLPFPHLLCLHLCFLFDRHGGFLFFLLIWCFSVSWSLTVTAAILFSARWAHPK